jgi:hypothetical protein
MTDLISFIVLGLGVFASILLLMEVGLRFGIRCKRKDSKDGEDDESDTGVTDAAVFGLMGLLIAFTFSGAAGRFDLRRQVIVEEANTIGTAYLRIDLIPASSQGVLREKFRQYVDTRLAIHRAVPDLRAAREELRRASVLQREIWAEAVAGCRQTNSPAVMTLVLGSINEMFDMANTRTEGTQIHPPLLIYAMLVILMLVCSLLAGNLMAVNRKRNWLHIFGFAIMLSLTVLIILDIEYPRVGAIRIDAWDRVMVELRATMN